MAKKTKADDPESNMAGTGFSGNSPADTQSGAAKSDFSSISSGVADSAKQAASQAKEAGSHLLDHQAKDQAASRADEQRQTAASGLQAVAHAFQSMGDDLRNKEGGPVAQYAAEIGQAMGGQVERLANYLRERDVRQLVTDTEDFARRSPAVFLGSAFVLGIAASRFLKSTRPAAPDFVANIPDPSRALPPASTPPAELGPSKPHSDPMNKPPFWATQPETTPQGIGASVAMPASVSKP